jgi:DNA repair photolyase
MKNEYFHNGRGVQSNPKNRFENTENTFEYIDELTPSPKTELILDHSKTILSYNQSPDIPFNVSLNPYRGCEHGCSYCYARPFHEFLGMSSGLDFETKIMVKEKADQLLIKELSSKKWKPQLISLSGITDPYQPIEKKLKITRKCLKVLTEFKNPVTIITKNHLVSRDIDILKSMADINAVSVMLSITTLDNDLCNKMEPRTSRPMKRLQTIKKLTDNGIPTGVMIAPIIPGLNNHEIPKIMEQAKTHGASFIGYTILRLPFAVEDLFKDWLQTHYSAKYNKVISLLSDCRGGKLNEKRIHHRMSGKGKYAKQITDLFNLSIKKYNLTTKGPKLITTHFKNPNDNQILLF